MRMGRRIRRTRKGDFTLALPANERQLLKSLPAQLRELLGDASDPDLRRLFPPAYSDDDDAEQDYRELMGAELLAHHKASLDTMEATLDADRLDEAQLAAWLGALNDLRLVLGTRLEVSEDQEPLTTGDPNAAAMALYGYLSWLQEQVVEALAASL
jgi:hypothetical protein